MNADNKHNIFLLIGQSNMAGRGRLDDVPELMHPDVFMLRDGQWMPAVEPIHTDKPTAGIGLAMSFAVSLIEKANLAPIGLIPCAVGGTPLSRWMPGADLYENAVSIAKPALEHGKLKGILWHQGEGDSTDHDLALSYSDRFCEMIQTLRQELAAPNVPVIAGELGSFLQHREGNLFYVINQQLRDLPNRLPACACVSADGLTDNGDNLHFNSASLREFGLRYAEAFLELTQSVQ